MTFLISGPLLALFQSASACAVYLILAPALAYGNEPQRLPSWEKVPELIKSDLIKKNARDTLAELDSLTNISLGNRPVTGGITPEETTSHLEDTRLRWQAWWKNHGESWSKSRQTESKPNPEAWNDVMEFVGKTPEKNEVAPPILIPKHWQLTFILTNGDYMGKEHEIWILVRTKTVSLLKIRGAADKSPWKVTVETSDKFSPETADRFLRGLSYLYEYKPTPTTEDTGKDMRFYYPHGTLSLKNEIGALIWNLEGYSFSTTVKKSGFLSKSTFGTPKKQFERARAGLAYLYIQKFFGDPHMLNESASLSKTDRQRIGNLLDESKPALSSANEDIIQLLAKHGDIEDKQYIVRWIEKCTATSADNSPIWLRSDDFHIIDKVNGQNSAKRNLSESINALKEMTQRLSASKTPTH